MNPLMLTFEYGPRTYTGFLTCDNLQLALPLQAIVPPGKILRTKFDLPDRHRAFGRKIHVLPGGMVWVGKYVINTNGTKILLNSIGVDYNRRTYRPKDRNYFDAEDIKSIRAHFDKTGQPTSDELYLKQVDLIEEMLNDVASILRLEGYGLQWRSVRGNQIARIELSKDYIAPIENGELVDLLTTIVSRSSGEPYNKGVIDTERGSKGRAYAYWSRKMPGPFLSSGRVRLKLYDKSITRLEVSAENVRFENRTDSPEPIKELMRYIRGITEEMADYLREIDIMLLASDERINAIDLTELESVLKYYGLDMSKDSSRILLYRLGGSAHAYTPSNHRGKRIGRKTFANLCDPVNGICDLKNPEYEWGPQTIALRLDDWKDRAQIRRDRYHAMRRSIVVSRSTEPKNSD